MSFTNSHVPDSYPVDQTKDVGEIPMSSSLTPSGAMIYNIPIESRLDVRASSRSYQSPTTAWEAME